MTPDETPPPENCDECGFRWDGFSHDQALGALLLTGALLREALEGVDAGLANTRPAADTWSILEYVDHLRHAAWIWRFVVDVAVQGLDVDLAAGGEDPSVAGEPRRFDDVEATIRAAEVESGELCALLHGLEPDQWSITSQLGPGPVDQHWIMRHVLHEVLHHIHDVGRVRAALGDGVPRQVGSIAQINRSGGGVPKTPIPEAVVGFDGIAGDHQADQVHHGRPFQALCLYGTEVIDALGTEGHPIAPGSAGENLTVSGLDWSTLRPGALLAIGDEVLAELSSYATPCAKNAAWFADRDFRRMDQDRHPGWSRLYATVLRTGRIRTGDRVVVEP